MKMNRIEWFYRDGETDYWRAGEPVFTTKNPSEDVLLVLLGEFAKASEPGNHAIVYAGGLLMFDGKKKGEYKLLKEGKE